MHKITPVAHFMMRPGMYIGVLNLKLFEAFIFGFKTGCCMDGLRSHSKEWDDFVDWALHKHFGGYGSLGLCGQIAKKYGWKKRGMLQLQRLWKEYNEQERTAPEASHPGQEGA